MSHFSVLVIGPDPEAQLAPFDENLEVEAYEEDGETYHRNPKAKWDWYSIGGRWTGWMKLKPMTEGELGRPGIFTPPAKRGTADQTILQNIDIEGMRNDEGAKAAELYDLMLRLTDQQGIPALTEIWEDLTKREDLTWEQRREIYHGQPAMLAFKAMTKKAREEWERQGKPERTAIARLAWSERPDEFILPREGCIRAAQDRAFVPYAVVKGGEWFEKGEMGWWGMSSNEKDQGEWNREFAKLLDGLEPETLITVVDCHI